MDEITIRTNHVPRFTIDAWDLTPAEREEFDYLDWDEIDCGTNSATFFRYRGTLYDLSEFQTTRGLPDFSPLRAWDGYLSDSFFSAVVVRYVGDDCESVVVGLALS